jgi:hypothetical protein
MDSLTGTQLVILAGGALVVAMAVAVVRPRRWRIVALVVGLLFPAYTMSVALLGVRRNPTANSMWPIGVAFACALTLVPAFLGAGVGELVARALTRRHVT